MQTTSIGRLHVGTSGWYYADWRGSFYPERLPKSRWLAHYAPSFDAVEVNSSFYRIPSAAMCKSWSAQVPAHFLFALKAPRDLTHLRELDPAEVVEEMIQSARTLGEQLGPILYQFPPWRAFDLDWLQLFVARLPLGFDHVFEFRHDSWYRESVREFLHAANVGFCIHDMVGSASPSWMTASVAYWRLHGTARQKYAGRYGKKRLAALAQALHQLPAGVRQAFVFFNNTRGGDAVADALSLRKLLIAVAK